MSDLKRKTIDGVAWTVTGRFGKQFLSLGLMIVLARLLSPEEFGLVAMVTVVTGFASLFAELGFGASLIQKQDVEEEHRSSVFWLNVGAGLLLTLGFAAVAPLVAAFYERPILDVLTRVVSLNFAISALGIMHATLLRKELDFRRLTIVDVVSLGASGLVAVVMAWMGFGVWSLVAQSLTLSAVTSGMLWIASPWRPKLLFRWSAIKDLLGFSTNWLGTLSLNYWTRNADNLLIGWRLGAGALGVYSRAYTLLLFPLINITRVVAQVVFPSFSIIQHDKERVARAYLRATRLIALFTFPLMMGLAVTARPFVLTVFGPQWVEMIPLLRVFGVVGMLESISKTEGTVYLSQGRADLQFRVSLFLKINLILGIIIGLQFGVVGVAMGYAIASFINAYPSFYFAGRLVNLGFSQHLLNLAPGFACTILMGASVFALDTWFVPDAWGPTLQLTALVTAGALVYTAAVIGGRLQAYIDVKRLITERLSDRRKSTPTPPSDVPPVSASTREREAEAEISPLAYYDS